MYFWVNVFSENMNVDREDNTFYITMEKKKKVMSENLFCWYSEAWAELFHTRCTLKSKTLFLGNTVRRLTGKIFFDIRE